MGLRGLPELADVLQDAGVGQTDRRHVRVLVAVQFRADPQHGQPTGLQNRTVRARRHPTWHRQTVSETSDLPIVDSIWADMFGRFAEEPVRPTKFQTLSWSLQSTSILLQGVHY